MDRARREERGNFKIGMAPPRFHKGLREKGKTGDGPYPNHLGRDWDKRRMGERREGEWQTMRGRRERGVDPDGPEGNSKGNKYKERERIYWNVCMLGLQQQLFLRLEKVRKRVAPLSHNPKVTSLNWFFCPTNSSKSKHSLFTIINDKSSSKSLHLNTQSALIGALTHAWAGTAEGSLCLFSFELIGSSDEVFQTLWACFLWYCGAPVGRDILFICTITSET